MKSYILVDKETKEYNHNHICDEIWLLEEVKTAEECIYEIDWDGKDPNTIKIICEVKS